MVDSEGRPSIVLDGAERAISILTPGGGDPQAVLAVQPGGALLVLADGAVDRVSLGTHGNYAGIRLNDRREVTLVSLSANGSSGDHPSWGEVRVAEPGPGERIFMRHGRIEHRTGWGDQVRTTAQWPSPGPVAE